MVTEPTCTVTGVGYVGEVGIVPTPGPDAADAIALAFTAYDVDVQ